MLSALVDGVLAGRLGGAKLRVPRPSCASWSEPGAASDRFLSAKIQLMHTYELASVELLRRLEGQQAAIRQTRPGLSVAGFHAGSRRTSSRWCECTRGSHLAADQGRRWVAAKLRAWKTSHQSSDTTTAADDRGHCSVQANLGERGGSHRGGDQSSRGPRARELPWLEVELPPLFSRFAHAAAAAAAYRLGVDFDDSPHWTFRTALVDVVLRAGRSDGR